jgi:hypothetical protein
LLTRYNTCLHVIIRKYEQTSSLNNFQRQRPGNVGSHVETYTVPVPEIGNI